MGLLCRQCGFKIIEGSAHHQDWLAQRRGFCCSGCEEVYDKMREWVYRAALKKIA